MDILTIVVLYKRTPENSETVQSLTSEFRRNPGMADQIGLLIWDNSPDPVVDPQMQIPAIYRGDGENVGVAGAYDGGMRMAIASGCEWLLLLDQDTSIPAGFVSRLSEISREMQRRNDIAAIVPILMNGDEVSSPYVQGWFRRKAIHPPFRGTPAGLLLAHNSGAMVRITALREIGGFDLDFWLDYSDIVLFDRLQRSGRKIFVAGDVQAQHSISISDYDSLVSPERYRNILAAESSYWDVYRAMPFRALHSLRLLIRAIKQWGRLKNKNFAALTFSHFWMRLSTKRSERLRQWKQASSERQSNWARHRATADRKG